MIGKFTVITLSAISYLFLTGSTFAAKINPCPSGSSYSAICKYDIKTLGNIISNGVTILFILATVLSLFFLIFGGIKWVTSGGDKTQIETARNWIVAAAVGLVITFLSYFILNFALQLFGLDPLGGEINIPKLVKP